MGALTQLWAGTSLDGLGLGGEVHTFDLILSRVPLKRVTQYLVPWARVGEARKEARDAGLGKKLWAWMEEQVRDV